MRLLHAYSVSSAALPTKFLCQRSTPRYSCEIVRRSVSSSSDLVLQQRENGHHHRKFLQAAIGNYCPPQQRKTYDSCVNVNQQVNNESSNSSSQARDATHEKEGSPLKDIACIMRKKMNSSNENNHDHLKSLPIFPLSPSHVASSFSSTSDDKDNQGRTNLLSRTPKEFFSELLDRIRSAKHKIILSSLYIGVGGGQNAHHENEILQALEVASNDRNVEIVILMDYQRGLRMDRTTNDCSASAVYKRIHKNGGKVFLFHVGKNDKGTFLKGVRQRWKLPNPLNEISGVFHLKAYIIDDCLTLSGGNLSEEYYTTRVDRYITILNGGNGLVDFYSTLIGDILCQPAFAIKYEGQSNDKNCESSSDDVKWQLEKFLNDLTNHFESNSLSAMNMVDEQSDNVIAHVIPTLQLPQAVLKPLLSLLKAQRNCHIGSPVAPLQPPSLEKLSFCMDKDIMFNLIQTLIDLKEANSNNGGWKAEVRLASAYLNPTENMINILSGLSNNNIIKGANGMEHHSVYFLTAGPKSHGFAPRKAPTTGKKSSIKKFKPTDLIAKGYRELSLLAFDSLDRCQLLFYEREGWTFHAKGLWISLTRKSPTNVSNKKASLDQQQGCGNTTISNPEDLCVGVIGSSNFNARSETLDVESNCVFVFPLPLSQSQTMKLPDMSCQSPGTTNSPANRYVDMDWLRYAFADDWNRLTLHANLFNNISSETKESSSFQHGDKSHSNSNSENSEPHPNYSQNIMKAAMPIYRRFF